MRWRVDQVTLDRPSPFDFVCAGTSELAFTKKQIDHMIGAAEGEESAGFESVDFVVWNNKRFRPNPLLCDGDGPIFPFRKWFSQFYVNADPAKTGVPAGSNA